MVDKTDTSHRFAGAEPRAAEGSMSQLQRALLPSGLPVLPQVRVAVRQAVGGPDQATGAGWFDAIPHSDGTVALTVGGVIDRGVSAVAAMGHLSAVLNELLGESPDLVTSLARANALATRTPGLAGATTTAALLEPAAGVLRYVTCGSPPPLVLHAGRRPEFLAVTGAGPLGVGGSVAPVTHHLQPGDVVLLYSDDLIKRPGQTVDDAMATLARTAADTFSSPVPGMATGDALDTACQLTGVLLDRTGYSGEATILAAQLKRAPVPALQLELPAEVASLHPARDRFSEWLAAAGAVSPDLEDLVLAVGEIVTNAIQHAYPPGQPGQFELSAALCPDGTVECQVTDHGTWKQPDPAAADRGNGLMVASHAASELRVHHPQAASLGGLGPVGTVITLRRRLRRPAHFAPVSRAVGARVLLDPVFDIADLSTDVTRPHIYVRGPVDIATTAQFTRAMLGACRGGTLPLIVDMSRVSYMDSTGVWALCELRERLTAHRQALTLLASDSSPAHLVMNLAGLSHHNPEGTRNTDLAGRP